MRPMKLVCGAAVLAMCSLGLAPSAHADEWNKKTYLTFSGPVEIPGVTLAAGTYLFQLADPDASRHVVMVRDKAGTKVYSMFMTIPDQRSQAPQRNVIMFAERAASAPQAIKSWFYPGNSIGEEFVYPKSQAMKIAKANHQSVLANSDENTGADLSVQDRLNAAKNATIARVDEHGMARAESSAATERRDIDRDRDRDRDRSASSAASSASSRSTTSETAGTSGRTARKSLPATASYLPLFGLLSGILIAAGVVVRQMRTSNVNRTTLK
jgi:hypothetical protein